MLAGPPPLGISPQLHGSARWATTARLIKTSHWILLPTKRTVCPSTAPKPNAASTPGPHTDLTTAAKTPTPQSNSQKPVKDRVTAATMVAVTIKKRHPGPAKTTKKLTRE